MINHNVPEVPYSEDRVISTRVNPQFHKVLRQFATEMDCSVAAVIKLSVEHFIAKANH
jgi:hypothetical protein